MDTVTFQNIGEIDPVSITTFGINAKETENPIGYFGTGLKYAIAVILRCGGNITIKSGGSVYEFDLIGRNVRGKDFRIVRINGNEAGFTADLGKKWEMWQAFRELYCNTLDEGGEAVSGEIPHRSGCTTITVRSNKFHECFINKDKIVLESEPFIVGEKVTVHKGTGNHIFYKKVRIHDLQNKSFFTYNVVNSLDITEDRTAKYNWQVDSRVETAIMTGTDHEFIRAAITTGKDYYEGHLHFNNGVKPSDVFLDVVSENRTHHKLNAKTLDVLEKWRSYEDLDPCGLDEIETAQLEKASYFCEKIGYNVTRYPIIATDQLPQDVLGLAKNGTIYISILAFGIGTKYVAATLIEEFLHLNTGFDDCSRELQNRLFNDLVSLGERVIGAPV